MKTAVIMSGHFRTFNLCFDSFKEMLPEAEFYAHLLNKNNPVEEEKNGETSDDFEATLTEIQTENKLQYSIIEDEDIDMNQYKTCTARYLGPCIKGETKKQITEKWIRQLNDYKKSFEWMDSFNQNYDMVYRIRPDLVINETKFSSFDFDPKYFSFYYQRPPKGPSIVNQINDKFFCGNYEYMKAFMTGIVESLKDENIDKVANNRFNVEQYVYKYIQHMQFDLNVIHRADMSMEKIQNGKRRSAGL